MQQIMNKSNRSYAKKCFKKAINLGVNFKLGQKVNKKHFNLDKLDNLLKLPVQESSNDNIIREFKE